MKSIDIMVVLLVAVSIFFQVQQNEEEKINYQKIETVKMAETSSDPFIQQQAEQIKAEMKLQAEQKAAQATKAQQNAAEWEQFKKDHHQELLIFSVLAVMVLTFIGYRLSTSFR